MTFDELRNAQMTFGLPDRATLKEIKSRHRELVKLHHPDAGAVEASRITAINQAYSILLAYAADYRLSFTEDEFLLQNPDEQLRRQFADSLWGGR